MAQDASRSAVLSGVGQAVMMPFWAVRDLLARAGVKPNHWRRLVGVSPFDEA